MLPEKKHKWRIVYAVCCLVYWVWVVSLSHDNFDMVRGDYRRAGERLRPERIEKVALQELVDQCRKGSRQINALRSADDMLPVAEDCLSWSAEVRGEQEKVVTRRLLDERSRCSRKLVLFYVSFGVVFLVLPPVFLYLLLSFLVWIFRTMKSVE